MECKHGYFRLRDGELHCVQCDKTPNEIRNPTVIEDKVDKKPEDKVEEKPENKVDEARETKQIWPPESKRKGKPETGR